MYRFNSRHTRAIVALAALTCTRAVLAEAPATLDQLKQSFAEGQYQALLPKLNRALAVKPAAGATDGRYDLLILKGETLVQLRQDRSASDAFKAAVPLAPDDHAASAARAGAVLAAHTSAGVYRPAKQAGAAPAPIDIVAADARVAADAALFDDLLVTVKPLVAHAQSIITVPALISLAEKVADLRALELAGKNDDAQSKELATQVVARATALLGGVLERTDADVKAIGSAAARLAKQERVNGGGGGRYGRGGGGGGGGGGYGGAGDPPDTPDTSETARLHQALGNAQAAELQADATTAHQAGVTAEQFKKSYDGGDDLGDVKTKADDLVTSINELLKKYGWPEVK